MSAERYIRAEDAKRHDLEAYPYFAVDPNPSLESLLTVSAEDSVDDGSLASQITTPEEDAKRLESMDHQIRERMARTEREAVETQRLAYEEGFRSGEAEGRTFGEAQYLVYIQRLEEELRKLDGIARQFERALHDEVAALALAVGEHLAAQEIHQSQTSIQILIEQVLEHHHFALPHTHREKEGALVIHLNPTDLELLGDRMVGAMGIRLVEDPAVSRGGLRVNSRDGILDATVERRRDLLMELIARLEEEGS
jgi:flagellar biosynthesis/type III secretory pathway protein FliH